MKPETWEQRLRTQLSGWVVWRTPDDGLWHAALPNIPDTEITADSPQLLRDLASERYSLDDFCQSCGVPAVECGHRRPESRQRP